MEKNIYTRWLALELRKKGFRIIRTEPNVHKPELDVYIFQQSEELEKAMGEIFAARR